jgi:hypothetical protein
VWHCADACACMFGCEIRVVRVCVLVKCCFARYSRQPQTFPEVLKHIDQIVFLGGMALSVLLQAPINAPHHSARAHSKLSQLQSTHLAPYPSSSSSCSSFHTTSTSVARSNMQRHHGQSKSGHSNIQREFFQHEVQSGDTIRQL